MKKKAVKAGTVAIFKLAAIGDVALACRALRQAWLYRKSQPKIHWIIDHKLKDFAQTLLTDLPVVWHPIDAENLFRGSRTQQIKESLRISWILFRVRPTVLALLHRDWRYKAMARMSFVGKISAVKRDSVHELDAYQEIFNRLFEARAPLKNESRAETKWPSKKTIGILVGGAQNQKVLFAEKRWPFFEALVGSLLPLHEKIILFGGAEDVEAAQTIITAHGSSPKIENQVGKLGLQELPKALAELDAFVSIDSGPAHIASIVMQSPNQRTITLFGPTNPKIWAPRASGQAKAICLYKAKACSPCYANDGQFNACQFEGSYFQHCMTDISVENVLDALSG